jgi:ribosomal-protein-alanine N-acetyltransferase
MAHPTLTTERLHLRPFTPDDAHSIACLVDSAYKETNPEGGAEVPSVAAIEDRLAFNRGWVWDGSSITFAVSLTDTAALIGTSTLMRIDPEHRNAMLSLWIAPGYRGDGYGTEAAEESIRYGLDTLGLHQIYAIRLQENHLSAKLMKRLGMRQKGAMEEFVCHNGTYYDCILHAIMKQDRLP